MKRQNPHTLSPDFRTRQKEALVRRHRIELYLNDMEIEALNRYRASIKGKTRAAICREAIMERVLHGLDENQPTLF